MLGLGFKLYTNKIYFDNLGFKPDFTKQIPQILAKILNVTFSIKAILTPEHRIKKCVESKQNSYKGDRLRDSWLTGITRSAGSCNLVTLSTNFAQYKNFV